MTCVALSTSRISELGVSADERRDLLCAGHPVIQHIRGGLRRAELGDARRAVNLCKHGLVAHEGRQYILALLHHYVRMGTEREIKKKKDPLSTQYLLRQLEQLAHA